MSAWWPASDRQKHVAWAELPLVTQTAPTQPWTANPLHLSNTARMGPVSTRCITEAVPTLVLAVVHPVLGGVIVLSQTSALGGIRFIRNVLDLLLGCHLSVLLYFLAISQWLEHSQVITVLLWLYDLGVSGTLALWNAAEIKRSNHKQWAWTPPSVVLRVVMTPVLLEVLQHEPTHQAEIKSLIDWQ